MAENDSGIEKETIAFYPNQEERETKIIDIKYTLSGNSFKLQLPVFKQGNAKEFLHFLHEFLQAKTKLGYNAYAKLGVLEQLLQGNTRQGWNTIKSTVTPQTHSIASFNERILAFKCIIFLFHQQLIYKRITSKIFKRMINLPCRNS